MLTSIALILLLGLCASSIFSKLKLPGLIGMIFVGILIGPYCLNLLDESILAISSQIRQIALVIILTRAGLTLKVDDLKEIGRPAILMCFVPACLEIIGITIIAPLILNVSILNALVIGTVVAAVSPAVIVPRMIHLIEKGYGDTHKIPQLILAGASIDDIFVIVLFYMMTALSLTGEFNVITILEIPLSMSLGILLGYFSGIAVLKLFKTCKIEGIKKVLLLLCFSFLLLELETCLKEIVPISALLAIMTMGMCIKKKDEEVSKELSIQYNKLWSVGEIFLFVLVGSCVNLKYALNAGGLVVILVIGALVFRLVGVLLSLIKTNFTGKEKLFCAISYLPKATVQAAIGTIPLSMGLSCGELCVTVAVLSILITAPIGALGIDKLYKTLLN